MSENNWLLQDGRSILVEFDAAAIAKAWGWFGNRSSGEGLEFDTPAVAWTNHAWNRSSDFIMAAQTGTMFLISLGGNIIPTGAISKHVSKNVVGTLSVAGSVIKNLVLGKMIFGYITMFGSPSPVKISGFTANLISRLVHLRRYISRR